MEKIDVQLGQRDRIHAVIEKDGENILSCEIQAIGCPDLLDEVEVLRVGLIGPLSQVKIPTGQDHVSLLIKELLMKIKGEWQFPYTEDELCHCRQVSTERVDSAIVEGAKTAKAVGRRTSAGTGCGTCHPDIEKLIKFRRKS